MITKFMQLCLLLLGLSCTAQAFETFDERGFKNTFVDCVTMNEEGVFLKINDSWIRVDAMKSSQEGVSVLDNGNWVSLSDFMSSNYFIWTCQICGTNNPQGVSRCRNYQNH